MGKKAELSKVSPELQGVSEEIIQENYDGDILEDLNAATAAIFEMTELSLEDDPFEQINQVLIQQIKRL